MLKAKRSLASLLVAIASGAILPASAPKLGGSAHNDYMVLTATDFETGISYRDVQSHRPIGLITNPCSYADTLVATLDWNDGTGERKPDTNAETTLFDKRIPVVHDGDYLFWDDSHRPTAPGVATVTTKITLHCLGDPPGDRVSVGRNVVHIYSRIPVNQVAFEKNGNPVESIKGHDTVDLAITLDAPAPPSGTWVKLATTPPGALSSLPPYVAVPAGQTQAQISGLEVRMPTSDASFTVTASTVGRSQQTAPLTVTP